MFLELAELGKYFHVDDHFEFEPVENLWVLNIDDGPFLCSLDKTVRRMPRSPNPSDRSGVGLIAPGRIKVNLALNPKKPAAKNRVVRFLELIEEAAEKTKTQRLSRLCEFFRAMQRSNSKIHNRVQREVDKQKIKDTDYFVFQSNQRIFFEQGTPEGRWWTEVYEREYLKYGVKGTGLYGRCGITLQESFIPPVHLSLPPTSLNKKGAPLCSRNKPSAEQIGYNQSEPSRIGLTTMRQSLLMLRILMSPELKRRSGIFPEDSRTSYSEWFRGKNIHSIYFSPRMGEELDAIRALAWKETPKKKKSKKPGANEPEKEDTDFLESHQRATNYICDLRGRLFGGQQPDRELVANDYIVSAGICETKGRANIIDFNKMNVTETLNRVEKWFEDLQILGLDGEIQDWFTVMSLRDACLRSSELKQKEKISYVHTRTFVRAALSGSNVPMHYITRMTQAMLQEMRHKTLSGRYLQDTLYPRMALLVLHMRRSGHLLSPEFVIQGNKPRAYWLGATYSWFEGNHSLAKFESNQGSGHEFHAKHLGGMIHDPGTGLVALLRNFAIYNGKLAKPIYWQNRLAQMFTHLSPDDLGPITTDDERAWFLIGWYAVKCLRKKFEWSYGESQPHALGKLLATYFEEYREFCMIQGNPEIFFLTYLSRFIRNPKETAMILDDRAKKIWSKKANCHFTCMKVRNLLLENTQIPESIPVQEGGNVVQGFYSYLGTKRKPKSGA